MIYRADGYYPREISREGNVLTAWGRMKDSLLQLAVSGTRSDDFTAVAGKSGDGTLVQVFVSKYRVPNWGRAQLQGRLLRYVPDEGHFAVFQRQVFPPRPDDGYRLTLSGLSPGAHVVKRYRISDVSNMELIETLNTSGRKVALTSDLRGSGVELLQITDNP